MEASHCWRKNFEREETSEPRSLFKRLSCVKEAPAQADDLGSNIREALEQAILLHTSRIEEWCADMALSTDRVQTFDKVKLALNHLQLCREKLKLLSSDGMWTTKDEMQPIARLLLLSCAIVSLRLTMRVLFRCAELVQTALDLWLDQLEMSRLRQGAQHRIRLLTASLFGVGDGREAWNDPSEKAIRLETLYRVLVRAVGQVKRELDTVLTCPGSVSRRKCGEILEVATRQLDSVEDQLGMQPERAEDALLRVEKAARSKKGLEERVSRVLSERMLLLNPFLARPAVVTGGCLVLGAGVMLAIKQGPRVSSLIGCALSSLYKWLQKHLFEPICSMYTDIFRKPVRRVAGDPQEIIDAQRSLNKLISLYYEDLLGSDPNALKDMVVGENDMKFIAEQLESQSDSLVLNTVCGDVPRLLLIQIQFMKHKSLELMGMVDEMMEQMKFNLQMATVFPTVAVMWFCRWVYACMSAGVVYIFNPERAFLAHQATKQLCMNLSRVGNALDDIADAAAAPLTLDLHTTSRDGLCMKADTDFLLGEFVVRCAQLERFVWTEKLLPLTEEQLDEVKVAVSSIGCTQSSCPDRLTRLMCLVQSLS